MKIDRSNYEIWLIDWLDGNLTKQEAEMLGLFLNENPDIKAEAEDLEICKLVSADTPFREKELLKKTAEGITDDQFEYLSIASLENDLTREQEYELGELIRINPAKRKIFDQIGRLKLDPGKDIYKHKSHLIRRTAAHKVIRITTILVSSAAVIALLISIYLFLPERLGNEKTNSAQLVAAPEIPVYPENRKPAPVDDIKPVPAENQKSIIQQKAVLMPVSDLNSVPAGLEEKIASSTIGNENTISDIEAIELHPEFDLSGRVSANRLVACNFPPVSPAEDDARSSIGRFIARNFREKLLRDESPPDSPLKGIEIAEAGIAGINKIFGWEMELNEKKSETGETKSVYFNSRILKFNAPVKKAEPLSSSE